MGKPIFMVGLFFAITNTFCKCEQEIGVIERLWKKRLSTSLTCSFGWKESCLWGFKPDSSTGRVLHRYRRRRGSNPVQGPVSRKSRNFSDPKSNS